MRPILDIGSYIAAFSSSPLAQWSALAPWEMTAQAADIVRQCLDQLPHQDFTINGDIAVHRDAIIESGAILKGPLVIGAACFVASGAYLRGGNWIADNCCFGPGTELKSSFVFSGTKLAHFNFVGDSILGSDLNFEAGSIICNYRNERENKEILVRADSQWHQTGSNKFGALVGDRSRIGANAVIAPGALLLPDSVIGRGQLCDQELLSTQ